MQGELDTETSICKDDHQEVKDIPWLVEVSRVESNDLDGCLEVINQSQDSRKHKAYLHFALWPLIVHETHLYNRGDDASDNENFEVAVVRHFPAKALHAGLRWLFFL